MKEQVMALRYINTDDIVLPNKEYIMTTNDEEELTQSLSEDGFVVPIFVRPILQHNFEVLDGKKRVLVARKLDIKRIPCITFDYMGDAVAKEYATKLQVVNSKANPNHEKEAQELLEALKGVIGELSITTHQTLGAVSDTRQEQELFQTVCTAYCLEAGACMQELRRLYANNREAEAVMDLLRKTQGHMLNVQHKVGNANTVLMQLEEKILESYNLIVQSLEISNNVHKYLKETKIL